MKPLHNSVWVASKILFTKLFFQAKVYLRLTFIFQVPLKWDLPLLLWYQPPEGATPSVPCNIPRIYDCFGLASSGTMLWLQICLNWKLHLNWTWVKQEKEFMGNNPQVCICFEDPFYLSQILSVAPQSGLRLTSQ